MCLEDQLGILRVIKAFSVCGLCAEHLPLIHVEFP